MHTDTLSLEWNCEENELHYFKSTAERKRISKQEYEQRREQLLNGGEMLEILRQNAKEPICSFEKEPDRFEKLLERTAMGGGEGFLVFDPKQDPLPDVPGMNHLWQPGYEKMQ